MSNRRMSTADLATVVKTGYLLKSPPYGLLKREHLWRRRFFVLYKSNKQDYQLKYFNSDNQKDRVLGEIDLRQLRAMLVSPDGHPRWSWVQRNVKCSPSCVLYINTSAREYFLVGNDSSDVNDWFIALSNTGLAEGRQLRSSSEPVNHIVDYPKAYRDKQPESLYENVDFNPETLKESSWKLRSMTQPAACKDASEMGRQLRSSSEPVNHIVDYPKAYCDKQPGCQLRPSSEPVNHIYDYPKAYWDKQPVEEPLYMAMDEVAGMLDSDDSLTGSVPQASDKLRTLTRQRSVSEASVMEAPDYSILNPNQRDIVVQQADLREHLSLSKVDGRLRVSGWTGQPLGLFHEGDQFLALNDLLTCSMEEFHAYLSRTLKKHVKVTILRHLKDAGYRRHNKGSLPVKDHSSPPSLAMPPSAGQNAVEDHFLYQHGRGAG